MSKKSLGLFIQKLRTEKGFKSSRKLAIRLKELDPKNAISHVSMSHIENGRFNTSREILTLIANALDYSVDGLLAESEQVVDDVAEIIKDKPDVVPDFLRSAKNLSREDWDELSKIVKKWNKK